MLQLIKQNIVQHTRHAITYHDIDIRLSEEGSHGNCTTLTKSKLHVVATTEPVDNSQ